MQEIYRTLAAMSTPELRDLSQQLEFHPDPWAVGARKMVALEIRAECRADHHRNKIAAV